MFVNIPRNAPLVRAAASLCFQLLGASSQGLILTHNHLFVQMEHSLSTNKQCLTADRGWPGIEMSLCDVAIATFQLNGERDLIPRGRPAEFGAQPGSDSGDRTAPCCTWRRECLKEKKLYVNTYVCTYIYAHTLYISIKKSVEWWWLRHWFARKGSET